MTVMLSSKGNLLFIHIPKAAGSVINTAMLNNSRTGLFSESWSAGYRCSPQHFHAEILQELFDPEFFTKIFTVVRNPYSRLVSEYQYRRQNLLQSSQSTFGVEFMANLTAMVPGKTPNPRLKFSRWVAKAFSEFPRNNYILGNHIRPQVDFSSFQGCEIFRLEDGLDPVWNILNEFGCKVGRSQSKWRNQSSDFGVEISAELSERIYSFYKDDFLEFGYKKESWQTL